MEVSSLYSLQPPFFNRTPQAANPSSRVTVTIVLTCYRVKPELPKRHTGCLMGTPRAFLPRLKQKRQNPAPPRPAAPGLRAGTMTSSAGRTIQPQFRWSKRSSHAHIWKRRGGQELIFPGGCVHVCSLPAGGAAPEISFPSEPRVTVPPQSAPPSRPRG